MSSQKIICHLYFLWTKLKLSCIIHQIDICGGKTTSPQEHKWIGFRDAGIRMKIYGGISLKNSMWNNSFSYKATHMRPSPTREIMTVVKNPDIISFAVGMPAPEAFPVKEFYEGAHLLKDNGTELLQYGTTDGNPALREFLINFMEPRLGRKVNMNQIFLTTGSLQALDLFCWAILDPGDVVITEDPSYMAAITSFMNHGGECHGIPCDADGLQVEKVPTLIESLRAKGKKVKFLYTIVNFQNPGGMTMSVEKRKKLAAIAEKYAIGIFEDDPYGYVRYEGGHLPSIFSFDKSGNVLYAGSFSKILAPGTRTGWAIGDPSIIRRMCVFKQSTDLCSSSIDQALIAEYCRNGHLIKHLPKIIDNYRKRRDFMEESMKRHLAPLGVTWTKPQGGFFYWINVPDINTDELTKRALDKKVAFVQGSAFAVEPGTCINNARLNYTYCPTEVIEEGIARIAATIQEMKAESKGMKA